MPREELDMTTIRRLITTLAGFAFVIGYLAPSALALRPDPTGPPVPIQPSVPATAPTVVHFGSPVWQFAMVAVLAAAATTVLIIAIEWLRARPSATPRTARA
jgi:hypothetical protein